MKKVFLDITKACNGNCIYCYTNSGKAGKNELTTTQVIKIIDDLADNGISAISIAGGEPFMREDIQEILNYSRGRIRCSITTNGTIVTPEIIETVIKSKIKVTVSIDTLNKNHASMIRKGINLDTVIANIKELSKYEEIRKTLSLRTTVSSVNIDDIIPIVDFCNDLKITKYKINSTNPFGRAKQYSEIIPEFNLFMKKLILVKEYCLAHSDYTKVELPIEKYLLGQQRKCTLGQNSMSIDEEGNCYPCAFSEGKFILGNISKTAMHELIKKSINFVHSNDICNSCEINRYKKYKSIRI